MTKNLMQKFIEDRKHLHTINQYISYSEEGRPHLTIGHPAILATFMGYLKFQIRKKGRDKEVFFRGQTKNYDKIVPSLLRGTDFNRINLMVKAYNELKVNTVDLYKADRFENENIDNLFQHYGIKSPSLDLVDNLYIAIWFATNSHKKIEGFKNLCTYEPSKEDFGWIYFFEVDNPEEKFAKTRVPQFNGYIDLRKTHSSLSARLHCQHGITYFRDVFDEWNDENRAFDDLVIASIKFPNIEEFKMSGTVFTRDFIFPNSEIDNTYKLLKHKKFAQLLEKIEKKYNLNNGELGQIWNYNF